MEGGAKGGMRAQMSGDTHDSAGGECGLRGEREASGECSNINTVKNNYYFKIVKCRKKRRDVEKAQDFFFVQKTDETGARNAKGFWFRV